MADDLKISRVGLARIATVVLGVVVLGIGLYSHFQSLWVKVVEGGYSDKKLYEECKDAQDRKKIEGPCPDISLEHYYVSMIIICFILSVVSLIASFITELTSQPMKSVDLGYHAVAAFILLIAAIAYIVSAVQIHNVQPNSSAERLKIWDSETLHGVKLVAGFLTILQALLYGGTALLIAKESENNGGNNAVYPDNNWASPAEYQQGGSVQLAQPSHRTVHTNHTTKPN